MTNACNPTTPDVTVGDSAELKMEEVGTSGEIGYKKDGRT
ncbi:putative RNA-binding protein with TRAM domain [Microbulbifer hydrolyticus]|uniref:RNA-binding protein with TRAM domain n=1 Tax=Microbulbifer hydrolyticus TaxID=48074 RepID=A0AA89T4J6_9GAMM|nr:putative RNA-binding protein with TRAM domain [Microbulbifer hydrolyticus]